MVLAHETLLTSCSKFSMSQAASAHFPLISFIFTLMKKGLMGIGGTHWSLRVCGDGSVRLRHWIRQ